jgi:hypothetical protein
MHRAADDLVAASSPQDANAPYLKLGPSGAPFGSSFKKAEAASSRKIARLLTYGPRAALAAGILGIAWLAGSYFSGGQSPSYAIAPQPSPTIVAQEGVERAELLRMKEEIRALQASVEAIPAAIAELAGKVERMQRKAMTKSSPVGDRRIQTATPSRVVDSELAVGTIPKQARKRRSDAFDPSQNPGAPGAPRSLGSPAHGRAH